MSTKRQRPAAVVAIVQDVCASCDQQCPAYRAGTLDHTNAGVECPRAWPRRWGCYGDCDAAELPPRGPVPITLKARRLVVALWRWAAGGFGFTEQRERELRKAACLACEFYRPTGNIGMGECRHPGCGCTKLKRWLPTERCPAGKWPVKAR